MRTLLSLLAPYAALGLAMAIVGSSVVVGKIVTLEMPVFLASTLRFGLAAAVLVPLLWRAEHGLPRLALRSWVLLGVQALCGGFLFTVFTLYGLRTASAASAAVITSTAPAWIGLLAWALLRERPSPATWLSLVCAVAGIAALNLPEPNAAAASTDHGQAWGSLLLLAAVVFEAFFLLLRKFIRDPLSPLAASTLLTLFGLIFFAPFGAVEALSYDLRSTSVAGWACVVYYSLCVTVLAYLLWLAGIVRVAASRAGVFTAIMPLSGLALSAVLLGERLDWRHGLGLGCVCLALLLPCVGWRQRRAAS